MKIITDSGATKGDWRIIGTSGREEMQFTTKGTNVSAQEITAVTRTIEDACSRICKKLDYSDITAVHFYTAGVLTESITAALETVFKKHFPLALIDIQNDLTGCARAACGRSAGVAAIIGTGSNSCRWDGEKITGHVNSGGYVIGDEGSASVLGKRFLTDFIKNRVPSDIAEEYSKHYPSSYADIVQAVYHSDGAPSAFLGSIAPFLLQHYDNGYVKELIDSNFRDFIHGTLKQYGQDAANVGVVGGFGSACREIISSLAAQEGITVSAYYPDPVTGLVRYHSED